MSPRLAFALAVLAGPGCKDRELAAGSGSGSAQVDRVSPDRWSDAGGPATTLGPGPQLAVGDAAPEPDAASIEDEFAGESRDVGWAHETERGIKQRLARMPRAAELAIECRASLCKLQISVGLEVDADQPTLTAAVGLIENGLRGFADSVFLQSGNDRTGPFIADPDRQRIGFIAYAHFAR